MPLLLARSMSKTMTMMKGSTPWTCHEWTTITSRSQRRIHSLSGSQHRSNIKHRDHKGQEQAHLCTNRMTIQTFHMHNVTIEEKIDVNKLHHNVCHPAKDIHHQKCKARWYLWGIKYCPAMSRYLGHFSSFWRPCHHLEIFHMITFQCILISPSSIPKSDLVLSHNSSCDDPISTSPVPKSHIVMFYNSSCYDPISTPPVPKSHIVMSHNSSC